MFRKIFLTCLSLFGALVLINLINHPAMAFVPCDAPDGLYQYANCNPSQEPGGTVSNQAPVNQSAVYDPTTQGYPFSCSMGSSCNGSTGTPITEYFDVGNSNQYKYAVDKIDIFGYLGQSVTGSISPAGSGCQPPSYYGTGSAGGASGGPDYNQSPTQQYPQGWGPTTHFEIQNPNNGNTIQNLGDTNGGQCIDKNFSFTLTTSNSKVYFDTQTGQPVTWHDASGNIYNRFVELYVQALKYSSIISPTSSPTQGEIGFRVSTESGNYVGFSSGKTGYAFRDKSVVVGHHWTAQLVFTVPADCSDVTSPLKITKPITFLDTDPTSYGDNNQSLELQSRSVYGGSWNNETVRWTNSNTGAAYTASGDFSPSQNGYINSFSFSPDRLYRFLIKYTGTDNSIFITIDGNLSTMATRFNPTPAGCANTYFSCNTTAINATQVGVTIQNNASYSIGQGFQLRQSPDSQNLPSGGFGMFSPGQSRYIVFNRSADSGETYTLYSGTDSSAVAIDPQPLCKVPGGNIAISCQNITVANIRNTNVTVGMTGEGPLVDLASAHNTTGQVAVFLPPGGGGGSGGGGPTKASKIPIKLTMTGPKISSPLIYYTWVSVSTADGKENPVSQNVADPFSAFDIWPHIEGYTVALTYVKTGNYSSSDPGTAYNTAGNAYANGGNDILDTTCMQPVSCSANISPADVEPGQGAHYVFVIHVSNQSPDSFSASNGRGYEVKISTGGGAVLTSGSDTQQVTIPAGVNGNIQLPTTYYSGYFDYTGQYSLQMIPQDGSNQNLLASDGISCSGTSTPTTKPYFQVWNSDTSAGGGFASPDGSCPSDSNEPYISPANGSSGGNDAGGIRAFATVTRNGIAGSATDFGAIAMGLIPRASQTLADSTTQSQYIGFYSASGQNTYFANNLSGYGSTNMGGFLDSTSPGHCAPDFFTDYGTSTSSTSWTGGNISNLSSGQYNLTGSTISGGNLFDARTPNIGKQITIYVDGDVTITGSINYPAVFDPTTQSNIPYFTLIARGNIYLTNGVSHLDGLYVAQPKTDGTGGVFATCDNSNDSQPSQGSAGACNNQLVINGAVIAQKVELLRSYGTLDPPDHGNQDGIGNNPAEVINYVPSMVIGIPASQGSYGSSDVFSLPPVF